MDANNTKKNFGTLRSVLWPIYSEELKQVLLTFLLLFTICSCYSILRNIKDTVILSTVGFGAEVIPFIKVWGILPGAFCAMGLYSLLANLFSREKVFYIIISMYLLYFLSFSFVLYPNNDLLTLQLVSPEYLATWPKAIRVFVNMLQQWNISLFYIIIELWAPVVLTVLFWGFVNEMTKLAQAKRFYGVLNIGSNIAPFLGITAGQYLVYHMNFNFSLFPTNSWGTTLNKSMILITVLGVISVFLFNRLARLRENLSIQTDTTVNSHKEKSKKIHLSVLESLRFISKDKYLICLALIVIGYNTAINFSDVLWKSQLTTYFTDPDDIYMHMNKVSMVIGVVATTLAILFSFLISRFGWTFTAIITPMVMGVLGILFFSSILFQDQVLFFSSLIGVTPLALSVYLGSMQNSLTKGGKYSVFDASKEIAYLSFDKESRLKGKASIDGLGSSIGKSGSSLVYQFLLLFLGSITACGPYIFGLLVVVIFLWGYAVLMGGNKFNNKNS